MTVSPATPDDSERAMLAFNIALDAGIAQGQRRERLRASAESVMAALICPTPDCNAEHDQDAAHTTPMRWTGPIGHRIRTDEHGATLALSAGGGDPVYLDLEEFDKALAALAAQRPQLAALACMHRLTAAKAGA